MTYYYIAVHVDTLLLSDTDVTDMLSQLLMEPQPRRYHEYGVFLWCIFQTFIPMSHPCMLVWSHVTDIQYIRSNLEM